jgi:flagellar basal body-associated protein FliL
MSSIVKVILWIVVLVVLAGGAWWYFSMKESPKSSVPEQATNTQPQAQAPVAPPTALQTSNTDASDEALAQDQASIDEQLKGLSSDSANISAGLSDTPISQQ